MVGEGVFTAGVVRDLARLHGVEMPITEAVCSILAGATPREKLDELMSRPPKEEVE
ncbi:MAG: hypothetical protein N2320_03300 [Candidatus Bipolaricaulota bacterium]|nr:hypothetical protein [Candidatus Bipolaricaulota bacterium]